LTKAQDELIRSKYSPFNLNKKGFEGSENRRTELKQLITPYSNSTSFTNNEVAIDENSVFFEIPDDIFYILQEEVTLLDVDECINNKKVEVIPITHDEYNTLKKNPFKKPNKRKVWRMDIQKQVIPNSISTQTKPVVEIISEYNVSKYKMRYLKQPSPIVLETFANNSEYDGLNLSVNGINTATTCKLSEEIQRDIIDRAVELAILGYRENTLQANVELNKRNI
jgi:hypothetical protein